MTNGEKARKLMGSAVEYRELMEMALADRMWNVAVREAQEVVELCLKGVLSYLLVDYPKVRDVGVLFVRTLAARGIELSEQEAAEVRSASARLAERRARAFYFEVDETEGSATEAADNARRIFAFCSRTAAEPETPPS